MQKRHLIRIRHKITACVFAAAMLAGNMSVAADEIMLDDGEDEYQQGSIGGIDAGESGGNDNDSPFLIEDTGEDVQYSAGVPMDTLQDAMDSGDEKTLEKIASLGALTNNPATSGSSGIGGGGAYRGSEDDEDDEEYYDLQLDEGDADEVEVSSEAEQLSESPGALIAANADRIQEHLDMMSQVDSPTGSDGELEVASYIETRMGELGYTVQEQAFHEGFLNEDGVDAPGINILAERGANSQTNRKSDIFLVVTHYDSKRSPEEGDPFANDKSGAAALIESARILSEVVTDTDICFLFLSGEEDGGYGAQNFVASLSPENRSRISGVLSVERVGYDSDTPYVLKTLTGERNSVGDIVQQLGMTNDEHVSIRREMEDSDEDDGMWVGVGESSDGYIDENTAQQIAAEQYGPVEDEHAIDIDTGEYLEEDDGEEMDFEEEDYIAEPVPMPVAWSYLKDDSPTLSSFAGEAFTTVTLSQYMPNLDQASFEETQALGLADATVVEIDQEKARALGVQPSMAGVDVDVDVDADGAAGTIELEDSILTGSSDEEPMLPGEDEYEDVDAGEYIPSVDASLVADATNVIAAALARIMDPAT